MKNSKFDRLTIAQRYEYEKITDEILEYSWRSVDFLEAHLFECGFRKKLIKMALKLHKKLNPHNARCRPEEIEFNKKAKESPLERCDDGQSGLAKAFLKFTSLQCGNQIQPSHQKNDHLQDSQIAISKDEFYSIPKAALSPEKKFQFQLQDLQDRCAAIERTCLMNTDKKKRVPHPLKTKQVIWEEKVANALSDLRFLISDVLIPNWERINKERNQSS